MKTTPRVTTFGEMLLRLSPPAQERFFQSPSLRTWFGGCEANVVVSLARLGLQSDYVTRIPDNAVGEAAIHALRAEGVGTDHIVRSGSRLGIYFVEPGTDLRQMRVVYDRAHSAFSEVDENTFNWKGILSGTDWLHVSGITPGLSDNAAAVTNAAVKAAREAGIKVSLDLNYRAALWDKKDPKPLIRSLAKNADVLIGNPVAVKEMLGEEADGTKLAATFGCRFIALTNREYISASEHGWSATLFDSAGSKQYSSPRYQVRLVDRVGGGDAFAAGLICGLITGREAQQALDFAAAAGAVKLTIAGDWNLAGVNEIDRTASEARSRTL